MSAPIEKHIVCHATQAWGHFRPLTNLAARLVQLRPVVVTLITTNAFYERTKAELARNFEDEERASRIRVISSGEVAGFVRSEESEQYFQGLWKTLIEEGEPVCALTNTRYPALPMPKAIILDYIAIQPFYMVKELVGDGVKVYSWAPGMVSALIPYSGPDHLGGKGNIRLKAEEKVRATGRQLQEVILELATEPRVDAVIRVPGLPPMYDHEYYPQHFPLPPDVGINIYARMFETLEKVDGLLLYSPTSYEPEAVAAVKGWFAESGRAAYITGPLRPTASKVTMHENEKKISDKSDEIVAFLDETLKNSGEKSLVYISFGSVFWPVMTPEKLWAVLDVLIERNIPFILGHASFMATIPDEIKEKVKAYGKGLLSAWAPQQLILDHPATGWFISHGGHNAVTEAISAGVPLIIWPFTGDQPLNAVHVSDNHRIGYELLESRGEPHGLKPIFRTGYTPTGTVEALQAEVREVLAKAFGEDGAKRRERLAALRKSVLSEWEDGGASKQDVSAFLDSL